MTPADPSSLYSDTDKAPTAFPLMYSTDHLTGYYYYIRCQSDELLYSGCKTNKYFEKRLGLKPSSVKRYLDDLIKLGLVMRVRMGASERKLFAIRPKIEEKL